MCTECCATHGEKEGGGEGRRQYVRIENKRTRLGIGVDERKKKVNTLYGRLRMYTCRSQLPEPIRRVMYTARIRRRNRIDIDQLASGGGSSTPSKGV